MKIDEVTFSSNQATQYSSKMASKMNIRIGGMTHIGGSGKDENQDTFFHEQAPDGSVFLGVFDGHGDYGKFVAEAVREAFVAAGPNYSASETFAAADDAAKDAILKAAARRGPEIHPTNGTLFFVDTVGRQQILRGGTTATLVNIRDNKVVVNHVGDSEVMVVHLPTGDFSVLTKDHGVTCVKEFVRCQSAAIPPRVTMASQFWQHPSQERPTFIKDAEGNYIFNPAGGHYYSSVRKDWAAYLRSTSPFGAFGDGESLNMYRAIGDFSLKRHGLTSEPDRVEHTLLPGRNIVLTASDGLFDNYTYEGLRDLVVKMAGGDSVTDITDAIFSDTLATGYKNFGRGGQDNTTLVLAMVDVEEPVVHVRIPVVPEVGGNFLCALEQAAALRLVVGLRGRGLGLTLTRDTLTTGLPMTLRDAERTFGSCPAAETSQPASPETESRAASADGSEPAAEEVPPAAVEAVVAGTIEELLAALEAAAEAPPDDSSEDAPVETPAPAAAQEPPPAEEEYEDLDEFYNDPYGGAEDTADYTDDGGWEEDYYTPEINHGADMEW
jgi:serine/threonine protein phosphatase PrpC